MLMVLERNILRLSSRFLRFYSTHLETADRVNLPKVPFYDDDDDDDKIIDQSWDATSIRSENTKSLRIAILGLPNAGKSTLINQLIGRPVCAASSKVQTTRKNSNAIYIEDDTQLIFVDTPGLVTNRDLKKYKLDNTFKTDIDKALKNTDIIGVLQDVSHPNKATIINHRVLAVLNRIEEEIPVLLILNKIDKVRKKLDLLKIVDTLTSEKGWQNFADIFMVSALKADGTDDLRKYLLESAKNRDWEYNRDTVSDEPSEQIIEQTVRAKFMDFMEQELPYMLKVQTEHLGVLPDGSMQTVVAITCPNDRVSKLVMGKGGERVKTVAILAEQELCQVFNTSVKLKIAVKFSKDKDEEDKKKITK
ncbi:hypothetical protein PV328_008082 [Microctonus aethiopoides]|uniref:GTPase Era, mitochondrial n=1 Tax=Microctonus aethiopoides TaxID=144406 RepID=A0AA39CA98_9HYME|nr:hypothetical protein PV328_008082 [Microctonus aethiopoides]